ncbi:MAG TPA: copper homeostasis periplasmic binding protein CopC [Phenylobacterium sp.]|uniref:copper homeostasis periplasmic binding protein CopC n=1 Tax=Phenylobacterium sp. TaxID=1871053 RepID=UPI002D04613A|nr:copper homeostasis periplasmic binding protein CopC [Phenylobacterium sp.]HSV03742.1 copper homeostasis periplasmic binding protein CopC [Phenylobacterium sp.]
MKTLTAGAMAISAALALAGAAEAHAHLVAASPAAGAKGPAPAQIKLTFSEGLVGKFSKLALADAAGRKAPLGPAAVSGKQMSAPVAGKLAPGAYKVTWTAVSTDTHRVSGSYGFTVTP